MMFIGLLFCALFENNLFFSSLIRKLFHFPAKFEEERRDLHHKKKKLKERNRRNSLLKSRRKSIGEESAYLETLNSNIPANEV
jgi:hypothetical protein